MKKLAFVLSIGLCLAILPGRANAGLDYTSTFLCTKNADSSGYCYGSPIAFFKSPTSSDYYEFYSSGPGNIAFYASYSGTQFSCSFPSNTPTTNGLQTAILAHRSYFFVEWNASASCTFINVTNFSAVP